MNIFNSTEACEDEEPSELVSVPNSSNVALESDRVTVSYRGTGGHQSEVGTILANHPVPRRCAIFYYELQVINGGEKRRIAIGFAPKSHKPQRQPGWEQNSYGYHADDGKKFHANTRGDKYAADWGQQGSVVGAALHMGRREIFFTLNGKRLAKAFDNVDAKGLYPIIGLHSKDEKVRVHFKGPFKFDIQNLINEEKEQWRQTVEKRALEQSTILNELVRGYLVHGGYADTLRAFDAVAMGDDPSSSGAAVLEESSRLTQIEESSLELRRELRQLIKAGRIAEAQGLVQQHFPGVVAPHQPLDPNYPLLALQCQTFLELIRESKVAEALQYGQKHLRAHIEEKDVTEAVGLLSYPDPLASPLGHMLDPQRREVVADMVNYAILTHVHAEAGSSQGPMGPMPAMTLMLKQTQACHAKLLHLNLGMGAPFSIHAHLWGDAQQRQ